jgi:hypothetical protein
VNWIGLNDVLLICQFVIEETCWHDIISRRVPKGTAKAISKALKEGEDNT